MAKRVCCMRSAAVCHVFPCLSLLNTPRRGLCGRIAAPSGLIFRGRSGTALPRIFHLPSSILPYAFARPDQQALCCSGPTIHGGPCVSRTTTGAVPFAPRASGISSGECPDHPYILPARRVFPGPGARLEDRIRSRERGVDNMGNVSPPPTLVAPMADSLFDLSPLSLDMQTHLFHLIRRNGSSGSVHTSTQPSSA
jgi:hypothetical protein